MRIDTVAARFLSLIGAGTGSEADSLRRHLVRSASATLIVKVVDIAFAFLTAIVLARLLGVEQYGIYAYAVSWLTLVGLIATIGLPGLLLRQVATYRATGDWERLHGAVRWSTRVVHLSSLSAVGLATLGVWIAWRRGMDGAVALALLLGFLSVHAYALGRLHQGVTQGLGQITGSQIPQNIVLPALSIIPVPIIAIFVHFTSSWAVAVRGVATVIALVVAMAIQRRALGRNAEPVVTQKQGESATPQGSQSIRPALPFWLIDLGGIANEQVSLVILGSLVGASDAGIFDVARRIALVLRFVFIAVDTPLAPTIARLFASDNLVLMQRVLRRSARLSLLIALAIGATIVLFSSPILSIFGGEFREARLALCILVFAQLYNIGIGSVAAVLSMTGHASETAKWVGVAAIVNIIISLLLTPQWGATGAAVANAASLIFWNSCLYIAVRRKLGIRCDAL